MEGAISALIGALRVQLSADTAQFERGMRQAQKTTATAATGINKNLGSIKAGLAGFASAFTAGLLVNTIQNALKYAGALGEVAAKLGVTTKDLQAFRFAAGQLEVSQEQLEEGLLKLSVSLGRVAAGAKEPTKALAAIGVSASQIKGKDTGESLRIIADGLERVKDRSQRAAVEVALFGNSGAQLDNLLSGGSARINELSAAAEKLGIVLSDEQIQRADETADKLEALKTVLQAKIAGVVADNAESILGFADALGYLVTKIGDALRYLSELRVALNNAVKLASLPTALFGLAPATQLGEIGSSIKIKLPPAKPFKPKQTGGVDIGKFLAGERRSRKGRSPREDHSAEDALRRSFQFDQDLRRAQQDVLRATQDLATDYVERTSIGIEILNMEKAAFDAEQKYQLKLYELTKGKDGLSQVQADQLRIEYEKKDALERQKLLEEEQAQRREDVAALEQLDFDLARDRLEAQGSIARTAKEQRDVQLRLVDLLYRQERARLEAILADEKSSELAKEEARRRLQNLSKTQGSARQAAINSTMGPWEQFVSTVPQDAAQMQEALEGVAVNGVGAITDALLDTIEGTKSLGEAFRDMAQGIIRELLRIMIQKAIVQAIGPALFGGMNTGGTIPVSSVPGFATGGSMALGGFGGVDKNMLSLNGLPIARVSRGEMLHIVPQGGSAPSAPIINFNVSGNVSRETMNQIAARTRSAIAAASKAGY